jgi:hypothetical protein
MALALDAGTLFCAKWRIQIAAHASAMAATTENLFPNDTVRNSHIG